jgi:putative resolvase
LRRLLADPDTGVIVVEHRDRLVRFGFDYLAAALSATGRRIVVMDDSEVENDLVRDMTELLTSFCVRLYGRQGARRRAQRGVIAAGEGQV